MYDLNTAERSTYDLIPAKTIVHALVNIRAGDSGTPENAFTVTRTGLYQLSLEFTVTEGEYARRKIFHRVTTGAQPGVSLSEGQEKGINIGKQFLRALLEAGRGFAPTDESPEAVAARRMDSIFEIDGLEVWAEVGVEVDKEGRYDDRNSIRKIMPVKPGQKAAPANTSAAKPAAKPAAPARAKGW